MEGQLDPELGQKRHEQRLRELGLFSFNKAQGRSYGCLKPAVHEAGVRLFSAVWTAETQETPTAYKETNFYDEGG